MLNKILYFSIHNKLIIGIFTLCLIVWGSYSLTQLPIDAVPDITNNQVQIITSSPSLAAPEVERSITFPIETTMTTIPGMEEIRSISRFGLSVVTIVFNDNIDIYWARQQVSERLSQAKEQIPVGSGTPELAPLTTGLGEIYQYVLHTEEGYAHQYDATELRSIQDWIVRRQLLGTEGVADVSSFGGLLKQYEVAIDPLKLRAAGLTIGEIFRALENNNQNTGGAYIDKKPQAYFIRSEGLIGNLADIKKIQVGETPEGLPILVRDIAEVGLGSAVRYGAVTRNMDGEVVGGLVLMLKDANAAKVIGHVKERIEQIRKSLPEGVVIEPFLDRTKLVNNAIGTVSTNLIEGALIVIFVLILLLGNLRAGLVVASVIPLSMLFAVSMMNLFGVSGNLMSLGAIDFGLIVDGAVIIVEATLHHIVGKKYTHRLTQVEMDREVFQSASKIRNSAAFGEIIILIVYLPILALVGIEGKMFRPMAQTVSFAILGAFILSLTYVPMVSALFLSKKSDHKPNVSDKIISYFQRIYRPALNFVLSHTLGVITCTFGLFLLSLVAFSRMGGEFIPQLDEGDFAIEMRVLTGSSLTQTIDASLKASQALLENFPDEVVEVVGKIGSSEIPTDPMPIEAGDVMVILKDKSEWTKAINREALAEAMEEVLEANVPGVSFGFQQPIQMRFNELMTGVKQDVAVKIYGEDLDILAQQADKVGKLVSSVEGATDLYVESVSGLPQIVVAFDRDRLSQFGISIADANRTLNAAFAGSSAGLVYEGERRYDLVVRLQPFSRQSIDNVGQLFITNPKGQQVPLNQLAQVSMKTGVNQIQRDDAKRRITVAFNVRGRDVESIVNELQSKIDSQIDMPAGYFATYGGQFQNLREANARLSVAVPLALILIFILLYFTFHSIRHSMLILSAIPLSAIGGIGALVLRGMPFSISAGIGFIALFGVAVLNGIVLIAEFNHLRKAGMTDLKEIIRQGTQTRLRPVLMTALVASLGFLPMALSASAGAEVQRPLATVVIGGLLSATLLTLLVLPVLYLLLEKKHSLPKGPKPSIIGLLIALGLLTGPSVVAQGQPETPTLPISLQEALQRAELQNLQMISDQHQIDYRQALTGTALELEKTNLTWVGGQYNGLRFDNQFGITQALPLPPTTRKKKALLQQQLATAEAQILTTRASLIREVKQNYHGQLLLENQKKLLEQERKRTEKFVSAAALRLKTGEGNKLGYTMALSELSTLKARTIHNQNLHRQLQIGLQELLNANTPLLAQSDTMVKLPSPYVLKDSALLSENPNLLWMEHQMRVSQLKTALEKTTLLPDITLGYHNQSLIGIHNRNGQEVYYGSGHRFQYAQIGLAIPIFNGATKARIEANRIQERLVENKKLSTEVQLKTDLQKSIQALQSASLRLIEFEENQLVMAQELQQNATMAYAVGEASYMEYMQALNRAWAIRSGYLQEVYAYNLAVLDIEYLLYKP
ncbi:cobalt-zinc-cadmium resistance protein CzcA [Dyadobacter jejuensis]|uniref:Cobalt-zinc-cadmium resistance protein CzcA n=1 Tax=Dyadobacter jejuensis TaxID=1082580 RepID=A0A316AF90_9BACT|nr:CusA/CzcA family heavy metal efflux RND transporter [Dyadobacter jejuensis]PWJ55564.1 cobalt-zinc-cadmium resistance protein CzcA [Dyadobacter jejuensis]